MKTIDLLIIGGLTFGLVCLGVWIFGIRLV